MTTTETTNDTTPATDRPVQQALPRWRQILHDLGEDFAPPGLTEIRTEPRPSLQDIRLYGEVGGYARATGPVRAAGRAWSRVAWLVTAAGYYALWVAQRPSRAFVAFVTCGVLVMTPWGGAALGFTADVLGWLSTLHTLIGS